MAITATALTTNFDTTNGVGPYTTASITPSANQPVLLAVVLAPASGVVCPVPTVSGCGLTWALVTQTKATSGTRTLFLFAGLGASPTTGAVTVAGNGTATFLSCLWQVTQLAGVATAVNFGVVQSVNAKPSAATSVSVAFGATITAGNATFGGVGVGTGSSPSAGSGWTLEGSTNAPATGLLGEFAASAQQNIRASWTPSTGSLVVGAEMAAAVTGGTDATVSGPVAKVTVVARAGTVTVSGGTVTVAGTVAVVTVTATAGTVTALKAPSAFFPTYVRPPAPYGRAVRNGLSLSYVVDASHGGLPVAGATGMAPTGGQITDTIKPGVRRVLNLELATTAGLFDLLAPTGTTLTVTARVEYTGRTGVMIPMGVFDIDEQSLDEGSGKLTLTAPDKWVRIQRARFITPGVTTPGLTVVQQLVLMVHDAMGASETVNVLTSNTAPVGAMTWDSDDRAQAMIDLATGIGVWVYFDRMGTATIADIPTLGASADWLIDASANGVLTSLSRSRSRTSTHNVVAVESSAAGGASFPLTWVWDNDPASPTYAGTDPVGNPGSAGPFGVSAYHYSTALPLNATQAAATGRAILAQTVGLASGASLGAVPNPAVDAFDVIDVLPLGQHSWHFPGTALYPGAGVSPGSAVYPSSSSVDATTGTPSVSERHVVDTVTHPLAVGGNTPQQIVGRSTRTDSYT